MQLIQYGVLAAVLVTAVCTDVRFRRIPNWLNVFAAAVGLLLALAGGGLKDALVGLAAGFTAGFTLWMLKTFRAGDAKLFAALGALMGLEWLIRCAVWAFAGGAVLGDYGSDAQIGQGGTVRFCYVDGGAGFILVVR